MNISWEYSAHNNTYLRIGLEVVIQHVTADGQITDVVRVDAVPALRPELAAFADDGVEVAESEENALELHLARAHLHRFLETRSDVTVKYKAKESNTVTTTRMGNG